MQSLRINYVKFGNILMQCNRLNVQQHYKRSIQVNHVLSYNPRHHTLLSLFYPTFIPDHEPKIQYPEIKSLIYCVLAMLQRG